MDNSKAFHKLKKIWYAKAKKSGFEDIEQNEEHLKVWHSRLFMVNAKGKELSVQAKEEYYRLAGQFLFSHTFADKFEMRIWQLHSEGVSVREICKTLKKERFRSSYKDKIHAIIKALREEMIRQCHLTSAI